MPEAATRTRPTFEEAVQLLLEETAGVTGDAFFRGLARGVARVAGARYGLVGEVLASRDAVATRAVWGGERFLPDFTYELDGTPCSLAIAGGPCHYERGVAHLFPRDLLLAEMGIEAYLGIEVRSTAGTPIGILVALHDDPLPTIASFDALLRLFALRAASELERRAAEQALRRSELRYRSLIARSPDGVCLLDPATGNVLEVNERFRRMAGFTAGEASGLHLADLLSTGLEPIQARSGGGAAPFESALLRKGAAPLDVEVGVSVVELDGSETIMATVRDISERRAAQAAILRLSELHELILQSAGEGIVGIDRQGKHTFVNPAAAGMFGYSAGELVGRPSHSTWHHTTLAGAPYASESCPILASLRDGEVRRVSRDVFRRRDGTGFLVEYVASPIYESGQQTGSVVVFRDISKEERLESVAEAVETTNSVGYVFSAIRHELGNPVNSVKMALNVLRENLDRFPPEAVRSYVDRSLAELGRVEELLASLRTFGLYDDVALRDVDVDEFVRQFLALFGRDYESRGVALRYEPAPEPLVVEADPRALRQVFLNLLANAVDALEGRLDPVVTLLTDASGGAVRVRIADNGCGMGPAEVADLFKPFRTSKRSGTGLGLVIARKMISRVGGTIDVQSQLGVGTVATLTLRRAAGCPGSASLAVRPCLPPS